MKEIKSNLVWVKLSELKDAKFQDENRTKNANKKSWWSSDIEENGVLQPIAITKNKIICDGHQRTQKLRAMLVAGILKSDRIKAMQYDTTDSESLYHSLNKQNRIKNINWLNCYLKGNKEIPKDVLMACEKLKELYKGESKLKYLQNKQKSPKGVYDAYRKIITKFKQKKGNEKVNNFDEKTYDSKKAFDWIFKKINDGKNIIDIKQVINTTDRDALKRQIEALTTKKAVKKSA